MSTVEYLVQQAGGAGSVSAKKMFGEYALFCSGKLVALVCDDQLFVKPTKAGRSHIGDVVEAPPYPSAKPSFLIDGDRWDDDEWLSQLFKVTALELPEPVKKVKKKSR